MKEIYTKEKIPVKNVGARLVAFRKNRYRPYTYVKDGYQYDFSGYVDGDEVYTVKYQSGEFDLDGDEYFLPVQIYCEAEDAMIVAEMISEKGEKTIVSEWKITGNVMEEKEIIEYEAMRDSKI